MTHFERIEKNILADIAWTERAILVLDDNKLWTEKDQKEGENMARFVRSRLEHGNKLGACMTSDYYRGRARAIVRAYAIELLELALKKAQADAEDYAKKAEEAKKVAEEIAQELYKG